MLEFARVPISSNNAGQSWPHDPEIVNPPPPQHKKTTYFLPRKADQSKGGTRDIRGQVLSDEKLRLRAAFVPSSFFVKIDRLYNSHPTKVARRAGHFRYFLSFSVKKMIFLHFL